MSTTLTDQHIVLIFRAVAPLCAFTGNTSPDRNPAGLSPFRDKTVNLDTIDNAIHKASIRLTAARLLKNQAATEQAQHTLNKLLDQRLEMTMTAPTTWPAEIDGDDTEDDDDA